MELSRIKAAPSASVAGGAAYANRNPLFRPPADGDSTSTTQSGSDRGSASLTAAHHPTNHTNHANRNGRGHDDRHGRLRPAVGSRGTASGSTRSDASGARLIQSRLSDGGGDGGGGSGGGIGGGGIGKGNREDIAIPDRSRHLTDEDGGDSIWSDMSGMEGLQHPKREGRHRRGGDGGGSGGHARTSSISSGVGMGHARTGSSSSGVGMGGGVSSGGMKGQEPAVKTCGCMTTATFLKLVTLVVALGNVAALWIQHYDASSGKLCSFSDKNACVTSVASKVLLSIARLSAGALFPSIACCVLSKCYATRYFLHHSWLTLIVDLEPTHKLHTYFGVLTLLCSLIHTVAHIARAFYETHPDRLYGDTMNLSGLAATFLLLPVAMPMMMGYMKKKLTYELRKLMHMLFIPFIVAICFHGSVLRTLGIVLLVWYLLDRLYFTTKMTFFIDRPIFKAVGRGTLVRFELPTGYQYKPGAYVQVNCPAISASEWHPFSIFPVPGPTARAGFHVEAVGDWTEQLFRHGLEDPRMPLWITAAQPSVLEQTLYYDNVLLVCSGAGITPAVSVAERFAKKKNVHLLWLSREAGMVAMFEKQLHRVKSTVYLTGKPSAKTKKRIIDLLAPSRAEVVAKTSTSHKPSSRASSCSDLTMLEDGALADTASFLDYRGTFRDDENKTERATDDGQDESVFGESMLGGSSRESPYRGRDGDRDSKARGHGRHRRRPSRGRSGRSRGLHPVSLNFGRPNIEEFIAETIQGTAVVAEWAGHEGPPPETESRAPPTNLRQVMSRLNTNQRMSKMDLMSADLSIVEAKPGKSSSVSGAAGFAAAGGGAGGKTVACPVVRGTWLVLYCGGNAKIEQAVASACNRLNVTWRREYFSAW